MRKFGNRLKVLVGVIWIVLIPLSSRAWFLEEKMVMQPTMDYTSETVTSSSRLVMFDYMTHSPPRQGTSFLMPATERFNPLVSIDIDLPLKVLSVRSASATDALDALLNANLALRMLLDEYNALQKRSIALFDGLDIPYLNQLDRGNGNAANRPTPSLNSGFLGVGDGESIRQRMDQLKQAIVKNVRMQPPKTVYYANAPLPSVTGLKMGEGGGVGKKRFYVDGQLSEGSALTSTTGGKNTGGATSWQVRGGEKSGPPVDTSSLNGGEPIHVTGKADSSELPWLFDAGLEIVRYVTDNKVETLFYCLIAGGILYVISLRVRQV